MKEYSISVAMPVYNGADYVHEAIESVLSQEYQNWELVISETASADETVAIIESYARRDSRIRLEHLDIRLPAALNVTRAITLCKNEWVKILCHDDILLPNALEQLIEVINNYASERTGLIGEMTCWQYANGYRHAISSPNTLPRIWSGTQLIGRALKAEKHDSLPALTTATVRRSAFISSNGFESRFQNFDSFYWLRFVKEWDYIFVPQVLSVTRIHGAQIDVQTNKSMSKVFDEPIFWAEYVHDYRQELNLEQLIKVRFKGFAIAGTLVAVQIIKRNWRNVFLILKRLPFYWLPIIPIFVFRSLRAENLRIAIIRPYVPLEQMYPE